MSAEFARTPEPPYYAVIFTSRRTAVDDGYGPMADRMVELASRQPGFLGVESTRGADGLGITVSYWSSLEAIAAWKAHGEHRVAQVRGPQQVVRALRVPHRPGGTRRLRSVERSHRRHSPTSLSARFDCRTVPRAVSLAPHAQTRVPAHRATLRRRRAIAATRCSSACSSSGASGTTSPAASACRNSPTFLRTTRVSGAPGAGARLRLPAARHRRGIRARSVHPLGGHHLRHPLRHRHRHGRPPGRNARHFPVGLSRRDRSVPRRPMAPAASPSTRRSGPTRCREPPAACA